MATPSPYEKWKARQAATKSVKAEKVEDTTSTDSTKNQGAPNKIKPASSMPSMQNDPLTGIPSVAPVLDGGKEAPEDAITLKGRMDAAIKALGPDLSSLSEADRNVAEEQLRLYPDEKLDLSEMGLQNYRQEQLERQRNRRSEALPAQKRRELVAQLEKIYSDKGLPLPEAYNIPTSERSIVGGFKEGISDALSLPLSISEASRKRKVDPTIESKGVGSILEQVSEAVTYPSRALIDALTGLEISQPYSESPSVVNPETGERRQRTVREMRPSRVRSELEAGDRMYGLRRTDDLEDEFNKLEEQIKELQDAPLRAPFRSIISTASAQEMRDKEVQKLKDQLEALTTEYALIKEYEEQLEQ